MVLPDYIRWPNENDSLGKDRPFQIGVLGISRFQSYLDETCRGRMLRGSPVQVKYAQRLQDLVGCQLLFICDSEAYRLVEVLRVFSGKPVVTIGDTPGFAIQGTMVNFFLDQKQIRMEVNLPVVKSSGLEISPQVLKFSKIVQ